MQQDTWLYVDPDEILAMFQMSAKHKGDGFEYVRVPYFPDLPDDYFVMNVFVDAAARQIGFVVSHPSFPETVVGAKPPTQWATMETVEWKLRKTQTNHNSTRSEEVGSSGGRQMVPP